MEGQSKYKLIKDYLLKQKVTEISLSFEQIEAILGFGLPDTAKKNPVWWNWSPESNSHPHAKNWNTIGWTAKLKRNSVVFTDVNYIFDSELKPLELSNSELEFYKNYPRKYVSKINLSVSDWISLIENKVFTDDNISFLKRIYLSPNHATTCYSIAILEGCSPSSYNFPIVSLAKRIIVEKKVQSLFLCD